MKLCECGHGVRQHIDRKRECLIECWPIDKYHVKYCPCERYRARRK